MFKPVPWPEEDATFLPILKEDLPFRDEILRSLAPITGACAVGSGGGVPTKTDNRLASSSSLS